MVRSWAPTLLSKTQRALSRISLICSEIWVESPRIMTWVALMITEWASLFLLLSASRDQAEKLITLQQDPRVCVLPCVYLGLPLHPLLPFPKIPNFLRNSVFPDLLFSFLFLMVLEMTLSCAVFLLILGQPTLWLSEQLVPSGSLCWERMHISNPGS